MYIGTGLLTSSSTIHRHPANPILTPADVPYEARLVFNAGVTKYQGKYVMVFRNDYGVRPDSVHPAATNLGLAFSDDGVKWQVQPRPCWQWQDDEVNRVYDPRLSVRTYVRIPM
ncbi:MAG: glycosidase, partial [Chloroflexi bacterium]|nr:glycosidase [Chloroflexota bacterium]